MTFKNFNQTNDLKMITLANDLIDYQPITVKGDKFYNRISKNDILGIVQKNKTIVNSIKNKSSLDLADYTELLTAIGFMTKDYLTKKFEVYCKRIFDSCVGYDFVSENNLPLIDVAIGTCNNEYCWYLEAKKDRVLLVKFKYNKNGKIIRFRGNGADIDVTDDRCFQIGKSKIIISDLNKKVRCFSVDNEYLFVVKGADNKYNCVKYNCVA